MLISELLRRLRQRGFKLLVELHPVGTWVTVKGESPAGKIINISGDNIRTLLESI